MANENKGSGINWSRVLRRNEHGVADLDATMQMLETEAREHIVANEIPQEEIATAVAAVYEKFPKVSFDLGSLTNRTLTEMSATPGSETKVGELIKAYVRGESEAFVAFVKGERETGGLYHVSRGKKAAGLGSVRVVSPAYTEAYRATQIAKAAKNA